MVPRLGPNKSLVYMDEFSVSEHKIAKMSRQLSPMAPYRLAAHLTDKV